MATQIERLAATAPMPKPIQPEAATGVESTAPEEKPAPYTDSFVPPITPGANVGDKETVYTPQFIPNPKITAPQSIQAPTNVPTSIQPTEQPATEAATAPAVDTSEQPSGIGNLTNGQLTYLRQQTGWDDNKLNSVYGKEYDPEKGGSYLTNLYQSVKKKPTELSPEREDAARETAGIGQSLQLLGDMYAAGKGAHVQARDLSQGPVANTDKNINDVRKLYEAQQDQYDNGLLNAKLQDYQTGKQDFNQNRAEITTHLRELIAMEAKAKEQDIANRKWLREQGFKENSEEFKQGMEKLKYDQSKHQFDVTSSQEDRKITQSGNQYAGKLGLDRSTLNETTRHNIAMENKENKPNYFGFYSGYGGKDGKTPISSVTVNAAPNDPNAFALPTGEKVSRIEINPKDVAHYINNGKQALANDPQFQAQYQAAIKKQQEENSGMSVLQQAFFGDKKGTREGDDTIGAFYAQYQYDSQHGLIPQQQQPAYKSYLPGGNESAIGNNKTVSTLPGRVR